MPAKAATAACILVRHAHAEWPAYQGRDFDRPLTERGIAQAHTTAEEIKAAGLTPERVIASPARRTAQTARILMEQLLLQQNVLQLTDALYNADAATLRRELELAATGGALVLLVAHNPGISDLARLQPGSQSIAPFGPAEWRVYSI